MEKLKKMMGNNRGSKHSDKLNVHLIPLYFETKINQFQESSLSYPQYDPFEFL